MRDTSDKYFSYLLENDAGVRLLRSRTAGFTLSFLYINFRENHNQVVESDTIENNLASFIGEHADVNIDGDITESLSDSIAESVTESGDEKIGPGANDVQTKMRNLAVQEKARILLNAWCSEKKGLLRRYHNEKRIPVVELSASCERLFSWIEALEPKEFVGTESRFLDILFQLHDLNEHTTEDPETRIKELEKKKKDIQNQINDIKTSGEVQLYSPVQIVERLDGLSRSSRELLSDFRQIEDNFRSIVQEIYREQTAEDAGKGKILGFTLDASRKMNDSPQGQSFSTFWSFLAADAGRNEINQLTTGLQQLAAENGIEWSDDFLLHLKRYLYEAGHKIIDANRVLSDRLNRLLIQQEAAERRRVADLIQSIKTQSFKLAGHFPEDNDFMVIQDKPALSFPQARTPVFPSETVEYEPMSIFEEKTVSPEALSGLFDQFFVDEDELKNHAAGYRKAHPEKSVFSLADVCSEYPVEKGLSEIVSWFNIAQKTDSMSIIRDEKEIIHYTETESHDAAEISIPKVLFS